MGSVTLCCIYTLKMILVWLYMKQEGYLHSISDTPYGRPNHTWTCPERSSKPERNQSIICWPFSKPKQKTKKKKKAQDSWLWQLKWSERLSNLRNYLSLISIYPVSDRSTPSEYIRYCSVWKLILLATLNNGSIIFHFIGCQ